MTNNEPSAYDLLSEDDRKTLQWVKTHGGLREMQNVYDEFYCLLETFTDICDKLGVKIQKGSPDESASPRIAAAADRCFTVLDARLMPEGYEWPRYEDDKPVRINKIVTPLSSYDTTSIKVKNECIENGVWVRPDNLTHQRPVLDANDTRIKVGDTVWGIESGQEYIVDAYVDDDSHGPYVVEAHYSGYNDVLHLDPSKLTHQQPQPYAAVEPSGDQRRVDRDALLALAHEMDNATWWDADVENQMDDWAARIRTACGVCNG